jgi:hypothetical protein
MSFRGKTDPDPANQRIIDLVAQHGHAINRVVDDEGEPTDEPSFAYSVGAWESYGAPELIVFGLDPDAAGDIINHVLDQYLAGRRFRCRLPEAGVIGGGLSVFFLEADPAKARLFATSADWYYEREPFPLWQIVWPGRSGRFPWHQGYAVDRKAQPDLTTGGFSGPSA